MPLSYKPLHLEAQQRLQEEGCVVDINALFGRPAYAKFMARPFYVYLQLKMPGRKGTIIPSSILLLASLFTRSIMQHPATNSLVTFLARLIVMCITERAQRYLSNTRSDKS